MKPIQRMVRLFFRMLSLWLAVSALSFGLMVASPVDPIAAYIGAEKSAKVSAQARQELEEKWGVNQPPVKRYFSWLKSMLRGDAGRSIIYNAEVRDVIAEKAKASLMMLFSAWLLSGFVGFAWGALAGAQAGSVLDRIVRSCSVILASIPVFWLALVVLLGFGVQLQWFPVGLAVPMGKLAAEVSASEWIWHMVLPTLTLSISGAAHIAIHTREKMTEVMTSGFVLFARASGESEAAVFLRHGLRNAALPALSLQFASLGELVGGSILIETVFSYPGLGNAAVQAGLRGDVPLLLGIVLFSAGLVFAGNFLADIVYGWIDPRMRGGRNATA